MEKLRFGLIFFATLMILSGRNMAQTKTIVAFGDSITAKREGVKVYSDLIKEAFDKKGVSINIINKGVPGNTTDHAKDRFQKDVLDQKPDLVIIQFGTNDSAYDVWKTPPATKPRVDIKTYENNIRGFISASKKQNAKVILVIPPPLRWTKKMVEMYGKPPFQPDKADGFNVSLRKYNQVLRKIAKAEKIPSVDLFEAYYEYEKVKERPMDNLLSDGIHPNSEGQLIEGKLLIEVIKKMNLGL